MKRCRNYFIHSWDLRRQVRWLFVNPTCKGGRYANLSLYEGRLLVWKHQGHHLPKERWSNNSNPRLT
jgi:hypothetical protein